MLGGVLVVEVGVVVVDGVLDVGVVVIDGPVVVVVGVVGVVLVGAAALVVGGVPGTVGVGSTVPTVCDCVRPVAGRFVSGVAVSLRLRVEAAATLTSTFFVTCVRCLWVFLTLRAAAGLVTRITAAGDAITPATVASAGAGVPVP